MRRLRGAALTLVVVTTGCARLAGDPAGSGSSEPVTRSTAIERSTWDCPTPSGSQPQLLDRTSGPYVALPSDAGGALPPILLGSLSLDLPDACDIAHASSFPVALYREGQETLVLATDGSKVMTYYGVRYILPPNPTVGSPIVIAEEGQGGVVLRLLFGRIGPDGMPKDLETIESWDGEIPGAPSGGSSLGFALIDPDESKMLITLSDYRLQVWSFDLVTGRWEALAEGPPFESDRGSGDAVQAFLDALAESVPGARSVVLKLARSGVALGPDGSLAYWCNCSPVDEEPFSRISWVDPQGQNRVLYDGALGENGEGWIETVLVAPDGSHVFFQLRAGGVYAAEVDTGVVTELGLGSLQSVLPDGSGILVVPTGEGSPALEIWRL